ncbi:MAG TPA: ribonuclease HII [Bacillus sp. (in: firmicutes)]|uniref:ribonuclease HII n=1 Tax=Bacillus litorisediminis TaxID=2922713 RepID=UPI001FAD5AA8|nr:ribonuclease HII [Bacillus litorisediminis]HWO77937.1 ribonuclease HII [Bacillus sp. (in: firmicutes)]
MQRTIKEIKRQLDQTSSLDDPFIKELQNDSRKGVQNLLEGFIKRIEKEKQEKAHFKKLSSYERYYRKQGYHMIAGIDEAGRGPIAGPVVAAAVILKEKVYIPGLNDSKQLTEAKREELFDLIYKSSIAIGVGIIHSYEIDQINIYRASQKAMLEAVRSLGLQPDFLLIDAMPLTTPYPSESIIKGDAKSISIAAASIVAKVTRDRYMTEMEQKFPGYGFDKHKGYGTAEHIEAIRRHGVISEHRRSFAPVKEFL